MIRKSSERWEGVRTCMFESSSTFIISHCGMHNLYGVLIKLCIPQLRALASCWNKENLDTLSKILSVGWYSEEVRSCVLDPLQLQPCILI